MLGAHAISLTGLFLGPVLALVVPCYFLSDLPPLPGFFGVICSDLVKLLVTPSFLVMITGFIGVPLFPFGWNFVYISDFHFFLITMADLSEVLWALFTLLMNSNYCR